MLQILFAWWQTPPPPPGHCVFVNFTISMWYFGCMVVVIRGGDGDLVEVVVVALRGGSWGCLCDVWMGGLAFFGLRFGVGTV